MTKASYGIHFIEITEKITKICQILENNNRIPTLGINNIDHLFITQDKQKVY